MKNFTLFIIAFLTVAFVLLMGEVGKMRQENHQPDYQAYIRKQIMEELK